MVEPVVRLINGRGYRIQKAFDVGLSVADDQDLVEYCLNSEMVLVTFDPDLRNKALRGQCQVLHIRTPERTARARLRNVMAQVVEELEKGALLVTVRVDGTVVA